MKKIFLIGLLVVLCNACEKQDKHYTQQSDEIETVKKLISNYNNKTYDISIYADTSQTFYNSRAEKGMTPAETIAYHQQNDANYSSRGFTDENPEYEMVVTDKGHTWVNCWLQWKGTLIGNNKEVEIPIHLTYRFVDGKIVREVGMWDPTEVVLALQEIEANNNLPADEKTLKNTIETVVKAWNSNDKPLMASVMTSDFVRTENGNVLATNSAEYGTKLMDVFFGAFPDFHVSLDNSMTLGNKVIINWTCTGTNTQPFQGNPATNKAIKTHGCSIWTIGTDGKASREDAFYDNLTLYQQLGYTMPSPK